MPTRTIVLNGQTVSVSVPDLSEKLLYVLREKLGQIGPKFGCGMAQCGACTVIVNGFAVRSCLRPLSGISEGASVRTLDGLASPQGDGEPVLHPMQAAFLDLQAGQCAFCISGIVMGTLAWIDSRHAAGNKAVPSRQEVADHLSGATPAANNYICRCGVHNRIIDAVRSAAEEMAR